MDKCLSVLRGPYSGTSRKSVNLIKDSFEIKEIDTAYANSGSKEPMAER